VQKVSGVYLTHWAHGIAPADERQTVADFFEAFPWDGAAPQGDDLTAEEFFGAFGDAPEPPAAPPTLRGVQADGRRGER
jgi:hypothetical protein